MVKDRKEVFMFHVKEYKGGYVPRVRDIVRMFHDKEMGKEDFSTMIKDKIRLCSMSGDGVTRYVPL